MEPPLKEDAVRQKNFRIPYWVSRMKVQLTAAFSVIEGIRIFRFHS